MAGGNNRNYVSFWFWFWALFVIALPCVGLIMTAVWAFAGKNDSRKNYFKALLAWYLIAGVIYLILFVVFYAVWPDFHNQVESWFTGATNKPPSLRK